jgi:hypothetical protein
MIDKIILDIFDFLFKLFIIFLFIINYSRVKLEDYIMQINKFGKINIFQSPINYFILVFKNPFPFNFLKDINLVKGNDKFQKNDSFVKEYQFYNKIKYIIYFIIFSLLILSLIIFLTLRH